jgi:hypothetical protein
MLHDGRFGYPFGGQDNGWGAGTGDYIRWTKSRLRSSRLAIRSARLAIRWRERIDFVTLRRTFCLRCHCREADG